MIVHRRGRVIEIREDRQRPIRLTPKRVPQAQRPGEEACVVAPAPLARPEPA